MNVRSDNALTKLAQCAFKTGLAASSLALLLVGSAIAAPAFEIAAVVQTSVVVPEEPVVAPRPVAAASAPTQRQR